MNARIGCVYCHSCRFAQCARCCQKVSEEKEFFFIHISFIFLQWDAAHENMDCVAYREWLFDNDSDNEDNQAINYLGSNAIMCPGCGELFEKYVREY